MPVAGFKTRRPGHGAGRRTTRTTVSVGAASGSASAEKVWRPDMPSITDRLLSALAPEYRQLQAEVTALNAKVNQLMATDAQFKDRMDQIDAATDEIAKDLQDLRDKLAGQGIPDADLAVLDQKIARLTALGKDPENPVPATT